MAEIAPFKGVLYDTSKVEASKVLAPPYDVIDADGRAALAKRDPHNCIQAILPEGEGDAKYGNAATLINKWMEEGVLVRDQRAAIYRYHQTYRIPELGDRDITRRGFIAAVKLHEFSERIILPHERTLKGPKIDRLKLMTATGMHTSQIFTLYSDPSGNTDNLFREAEAGRPVVDGTTDDGTRHRVWRVTDREMIGDLAHLIAPLKLYIADGHHRYETMLAYRRQLEEAEGGNLGWKSAAQYGTMFLANMDDTGMVVLPTHRMVFGLDGFKIEDMLEKARPYFSITKIENAVDNPDRVHAELRSSSSSIVFVALVPGQPDGYRLELDPHTRLDGPKVLADLDVSVLHSVVLEKILGISKEAQEAKTNLEYLKEYSQVVEQVKAGAGQVCFVMNATRLGQVRKVSDAGEVMPQKSTYFYPKIASGLVFNPIHTYEEL
jgi:uncharacterized protein (DUF1015 family)